MSRSSLLLALLICTFAADARAAVPSDSVKPRFTIGSTQMALGYARHDFAALNSRMAAAGLPRVANAAATIGIGADMRMQRLLIGATYQSMLTRNSSDDAFRTRSSGSISIFDLGVAAVKTSRLSVYPLVGVGAAHLTLNVKELGDFSFDDGLASPRREMGMSGSVALAYAGLLVERKFSRKDSEFAVALRAGMARSFGSQRWDSDESRVTDGPAGMNGSYVRLAMSKPIGRRRDAAVPMAGTLVQALVR
jgi:hypothetical protein